MPEDLNKILVFSIGGAGSDVPDNAITTDALDPIVTDTGDYVTTDS